MENMLFVCAPCHFEIESLSKPCQCPDCGKRNRVRTATMDEARAFQARKLEDIWIDFAPIMAG